MGRLFASLAPFMLLAPDGIAPGGSSASAEAPAAAPGTGAEGSGTAPAQNAAQAAPRTTVDQLPTAALAARLRSAREQARREALAEAGIEDLAKFKADREEQEKKLAEYERSAEEQKRASMTEVDRLKADNAAKDQRIAELEAQLRSAHSEAASTRFDVVVQRTVGESIHQDMQEFATDALRRHMKALPKDQLRKFGEAETRVFFAKLAKDRPRFALDQPAAPKPPIAPRKVPLSNGVNPKAAGPGGVAQPPNGKKPASQLTRAELDEKWRKYGASRAPG